MQIDIRREFCDETLDGGLDIFCFLDSNISGSEAFHFIGMFIDIQCIYSIDTANGNSCDFTHTILFVEDTIIIPLTEEYKKSENDR